VRTRLKRALERLRADLDAKHGGDRAAWGLALLPTALPSGGVLGGIPASVALHALVFGGLGALAMSSKVKLAVAGAFAAAATAAIVHFGFGDGARPRSPDAAAHAGAPLAAEGAAAPTTPTASAADTPAPTAERAKEATPATTPTTTAPFVVHGRTLDFAGKPLAHLHVKLARHDGYETDGKPDATATVESGDDGAFEWGLPLPAGTVTLTAVEDEPDFWGDPERALVFSGDAPAPLDVTLHAFDLDVTGRVTGEHDEPLGDAHVAGGGGAADCDENGEYSFRACSTLRQTWMIVHASGYVPNEALVQLPGPPRPFVQNFRLRPGTTIRGRVVDTAGAPISGARVCGNYRDVSTSGADGRYELRGIDPQESEAYLDVTHPDFATTNEVVTIAGASLHDVVLQRGSTVLGVVFDTDGKPARAARVWIGMDADVAGTPNVLAHDDGAFAFTHVRPGEQRIGARLAGRPSVQRGVVVPADPPLLDGIELRFVRGHVLAGIVRDPEGRPIAGASVLTRRNPSNYDVYTKSDEKGRFRLEAVPAETTLVEAYAAGFESAQLHNVPLDREDVELVMARGGGLAGTVVDAATGAPLESFRVRFVSPHVAAGERGGSNYESTWQDPGRTFHSTKGIWTTTGEALPLHSIFGVEASADGYAPTYDFHVVASASPDPAALVLRLGRGTRVEGTVVDPRGAPVAGAFVELSIGGIRRNWFEEKSGDPRWSVRSGDDGTFTIEGASAGEGWLTVTHPDFLPAEDGPFAIAAAGPAGARTIALARGGAIDGVAIGDDGRPVAGGSVMCFDPRLSGTGKPPPSTTTGGDGRFRFEHVRAGTVQVSLVERLQWDTVNRWSARATVVDDATTSIRLEGTGDARITGRIEGDRSKFSAIRVDAQWLGPAGADAPKEGEAGDGELRDRGIFASGERFEFPRVAAGRWRISCRGRSTADERTWSALTEVTVAAGDGAEVTLRLAPSK
jgi:protocatechuate 3,4-dioxygenase beta subunit